MTFPPANAHTLSGSIRVAAPPAKVWELITTVARITEWYDTWDAVEHATDDTALCRVTSVEAPRRLCWLQHASQLPPMSVEFQLIPDTEGATYTWVNHTRTWIKPNQPLS
jgi:uncharacterized protein YndB with AHSA1/START domain